MVPSALAGRFGNASSPAAPWRQVVLLGLSCACLGRRLLSRRGIRKLTHVDEEGGARMVDVAEKPESVRTATASGRVLLGKHVYELVKSNNVKKGDVLTVAQIAGIGAAKQTSQLIPLCHPLFLTKVDVKLTLLESTYEVLIESYAKCTGKTGVEMEALSAVTVAALTVYDMCKAVSRDLKITDVQLTSKTGGTRGDFHRDILSGSTD
uniref:cyclic pyranopterin monophosphate synthase n=1 Tax=Rhipicephalus appendiculatus TaxID=34631 RepID=A0A131YP04_RHIAP